MDDRRKLAGGREIWVIKAGFPDTPAKKNWSDYVFAYSLKKYLERLGCFVVIESCDEWLNDYATDVVIVLRGGRKYYPDRSLDDRIYIMWNLSHPGQISDEEYNAYDLICISSEPYSRKVRERVEVLVRHLPMCADTEIFYPDSDPEGKKEYDWIFVGNSRYMERKSVTWSVAHNIPLKIWGSGWKNFVPDYDEHVVADHMPNSRLPELYRNAKVTVCDHYEDMIENGFINTRIVEAFACGLPVISDYSEVLGEMFGEAILCYRDEADFTEQIKKVTEEYKTIKKNVMALWPLIRERYSFEACASSLTVFALEARKYREKYRKQIKKSVEEPETSEYRCNGADVNIRKLHEELEKTKKQLQKVKAEKEELNNKFQKAGKEKAELNQKLQRTYKEKSEINRKLQITYKEKSEINRKLQITYGEKYDRGLKIKSLEKQLAAVKSSRTYRLARRIGFPVRFFRKVMKYIKEYRVGEQ